jgi:aspartyl-tRNA(Asn)/glutamyl-tRNA(Gln) amidotransferase subunit B
MDITTEINGDWIYTYQGDKLISMKLSPEAYKKQFGIVDDLYGRMVEYGYKVSPDSAKKLRVYIDDNIMRGYSYFVGVCVEPELADEVIKWIIGPLTELINEYKVEKPTDLEFTSVEFFELIKAVVDKKVTPTMGKEILRMMAEGGKLSEILTMDQFKISSSDDLQKMVEEIIAVNPEQVTKAKTEPKILSWFVGQAMKKSGGKIDAKMARELFEKLLVKI